MKQSPNDPKQYLNVTLTNGLRCLLIEEPQAQNAAASLVINVGHFDDPISRPGMAHLLEHMLFLGTEEYPKPDEYHAFISQHGGQHNAWTGSEHTAYFFDIQPNYFEQGLARFSQFFISPLLSSQWLDKERHAIESEYRLKIEDDNRRIYQVYKETVNQDHPFSRFSVGNLTTLDNNDNQLHQQLQHFYQQHYQARFMTLVMSSPFALSTMKQMVNQWFSAIKNDPLLGNKPGLPPLLKTESNGQIISITPKKALHKLQLSFPLPSTLHLYKTKPLTFLAHLLGHEGKGSLTANLKKMGLINGLSAGGGISGSNFSEFTIDINLTAFGEKNWQQIVAHFFHFLSLVKAEGISAWRYHEKAQILDNAFHFQDEDAPLDRVSQLALNMHYYPDSDLLQGDYMMQEFDKEQIESLLALFTPNRLRVFCIWQNQATDNVASWYHTPYAISATPQRLLTQWQQQLTQPAIKDSADKDQQPRFELPGKNPFVVNITAPSPTSEHTAPPELLINEQGFRLWFQQEHDFNQPKGDLYISVESEHAVSSPLNIATTRLAIELLLDQLAESTYQAETAGLHYQLYPHQGGFTIHTSGYCCQQIRLLEMILNGRTAGHFNPHRFEIIKSQLLKNWQNQAAAKPVSVLFNQLSSLMMHNNPPNTQLIRKLEQIQLAEMPDFVFRLYQSIHIEILVYGAWQQQDALKVAKLAKSRLTHQGKLGAEAKRRLVDINKRGTLIKEVTLSHPDSAVIVYYQSKHTDPLCTALYTMANHMMSSSYFHQLRTKQQLGYLVGCNTLPMNRHPGLIFYIQSDVAGPKQLLNAIDSFTHTFPQILMSLTETQWEQHKSGLLSLIDEPAANRQQKAQRYWSMIGNKDWEFNYNELVATHIAAMSRQQLLKFIISLRSTHSDRVIVCSYGSQHQDSPRIMSGQFIRDYNLFKLQSRRFFSS